LLIGPGFVLIGVGLLLMRGLTPASTWTHLLPGMIVAGVGAGFVNVPLVLTAVGVVEPVRAGMASGINSTLRQVGAAHVAANTPPARARRRRGPSRLRQQAERDLGRRLLDRLRRRDRLVRARRERDFIAQDEQSLALA
jgi:hypothetical protein